jgi:hypothetical protein
MSTLEDTREEQEGYLGGEFHGFVTVFFMDREGCLVPYNGNNFKSLAEPDGRRGNGGCAPWFARLDPETFFHLSSIKMATRERTSICQSTQIRWCPANLGASLAALVAVGGGR